MLNCLFCQNAPVAGAFSRSDGLGFCSADCERYANSHSTEYEPNDDSLSALLREAAVHIRSTSNLIGGRYDMGYYDVEAEALAQRLEAAADSIPFYDDIDDSMDGDHESALESVYGPSDEGQYDFENGGEW